MDLQQLLEQGKKDESGSGERWLIHGDKGIGKSSLVAHMPNVLYTYVEGEYGILSLKKHAQVPDVPTLPAIDSYAKLVDVFRMLYKEEHPYKRVVIDQIGGLERQIHQKVCDDEFSGLWEGKDSFAAYGRGYARSLKLWQNLLYTVIDSVVKHRGIDIILLSHTQVTTIKNPEGEDYDRYTPAIRPNAWDLVNGWANIVLFLKRELEMSHIKKGADIQKTISTGYERVIACDGSPSYDAKNQHGLPEKIPMGNSAAESWSNLEAALKGVRDG